MSVGSASNDPDGAVCERGGERSRVLDDAPPVIVSPNCKSPICANPKLLTFWLVDDGAPGRDVGFANRAGKVCRCTDGRSGCC